MRPATRRTMVSEARGLRLKDKALRTEGSRYSKRSFLGTRAAMQPLRTSNIREHCLLIHANCFVGCQNVHLIVQRSHPPKASSGTCSVPFCRIIFLQRLCLHLRDPQHEHHRYSLVNHSQIPIDLERSLSKARHRKQHRANNLESQKHSPSPRQEPRKTMKTMNF